jgi:hypothetical protein
MQDNLDRIFEHAGKAMQESGKMLTDIQLEALALLQHYIEEANGVQKPDDKASRAGTDK